MAIRDGRPAPWRKGKRRSFVSGIIAETRDRVRFITLNQPDRHNAFDDALIGELTAAFERAAAEDDLRAVVLQSVGMSFL